MIRCNQWGHWDLLCDLIAGHFLIIIDKKWQARLMQDTQQVTAKGWNRPRRAQPARFLIKTFLIINLRKENNLLKKTKNIQQHNNIHTNNIICLYGHHGYGTLGSLAHWPTVIHNVGLVGPPQMSRSTVQLDWRRCNNIEEPSRALDAFKGRTLFGFHRHLVRFLK